MKKKFTFFPLKIFITTAILSSFAANIFAQVTQTCATTVANGQNIVANSDFSAGNSGFTFSPGYTYFTCTPLPSSSCFSSPGQLWAGGHSDWFNQGFNVGSAGFGNTITDHSPTADNNFLMVDGQCSGTPDAWIQTVTVTANTWYYFETWVTNLNLNAGTVSNATLALYINGTQELTFNPPTAQGTWTHYSYSWNSGAATSATLSIRNITTTGCGSGVDFGLDDVTLTPGCAFADVSTQTPTLASTGTLCGTGGAGIALNSGVPGTYSFTWKNSAGTTVSTSGPSYTATTAGTYVVCVQNGAGCMKSDVITITSTYTLATLPNPVLCNPGSATLNPGFTGTGVTFQWQSSPDGTTWTDIPGVLGAAATYTASTIGYYRVTTTDPSCLPSQTSNAAHVTTLEPGTPNNKYFCPNAAVNLSINNTAGHTYQWYTDAAATNPIAGATNSNYVTPVLSANATYYVKDLFTFHTTVGKAALTSPYSQTGLDQYATQFTAGQSFTIDSVTVYWFMNNNNPNDPLKIQFQLMTASSGTTNGTLNTTGPIFSTTNTLAQSAGLVLAPGWPNSAGQVYGVRVPVGITVPSAGNWGLTVNNGNTTGNVQIESGGVYSYPYNDASGTGVVSITSTQLSGNNATTTKYGGMYNWAISYKNSCQAIPVTATVDCSQPVEFISFNIRPNSFSVDLSWETGLEINADYFQIEKSDDGIHFNAIGKIKAAGNSYGIKSYHFTDHTSSDGTAYYRINEIDFDGNSTFSPTLSINEYNNLLIDIAPNPGTALFNISIENIQQEGNVGINIVNSFGESIYSKRINSSGSSSLEKLIDLSGFASGIYYLSVITDKNKVVRKIVKE
jgi:hypothetical protein